MLNRETAVQTRERSDATRVDASILGQHQQQRGATGAARQAMVGGTRKTTAALVHFVLLLLGRQVLLRLRFRSAGDEASGGGASQRSNVEIA